MSPWRLTPFLVLAAPLAACSPTPREVERPPPPASSTPAPTASAIAAPPAPPPAPTPEAAAEPAPPPAPPKALPFERRCGWMENPTPANWWLVDKDDTWVIGVQGGHQADGEMPDFGKAWVETNVHYGHGCACAEMQIDHATKRVMAYRAVRVLPISRCQQDKRLPRR